MVGLDAHVTAVALVMALNLNIADSPNSSTQFLISQLVVSFLVTAMLAVTAILHHDQKRGFSNVVGVSFLVFGFIWVYLATTLFAGAG